MDHNHLHFSTVPDLRSIQNQPTSTADSPSDEPMADADEPPDDQNQSSYNLERRFGVPAPIVEKAGFLHNHASTTNEFKKVPYPATVTRKQSLLTQTLHTSDENDDDEPLFSGSNRAHSSASTWSRGSRASTADFTSDGHTSPLRSGSPSPRMRFAEEKPVFNHESFKGQSTIKFKGASESVDPLAKKTATPVASSNEEAVEKGLGRKRCIMFACGGKKKEEDANNKKTEEKPKVEEAVVVKKEEPPKRACTLKFVCPSRGNATPTSNPTAKPHIRLSSPPPPTTTKRIPPSPRTVSPKVSRTHRDSTSTLRADSNSPKSVRKVPSNLRRRQSSTISIPISEATRFHEFASSEEERDDWTQEATCHRGRLTVQDTLKIENDLRHVCEEAADEEAIEEEEAEEQMEAYALEGEELDLEDDDDDEEGVGDSRSLVDSTGYVTDEGFHTDDEEGFANSEDDDSDADSDYAWWAPTTASGERGQIEHIRPSTRRSESGSSIGSFSSTRVFPSKTPKALKRSKTNPIEFRPRTPELPDSTDFVCGTLDEDRPLEEAWLSCRNQRRAANHRPCPQDIDPTFPASDPEMDEEDEEGYEDAMHISESERDMGFMHTMQGGMSDIDHDHEMEVGGVRERGRQALERRGSIVPMKRSPATSPRRLRSPPPAKRVVHRSPPPQKGKRTSHRSPPPPLNKRTSHRSPPPPVTKRTSHRSPPPQMSKQRMHSPPPPTQQATAGAPAAGAGANRHLLFGHSPRRLHSPPPRRPLRSPPPSRRTSFTNPSPPDTNATPIALAQRPRFAREASSLPRNGPYPNQSGRYFESSPNGSDEDDGEETQTDALPTRGAIDIVKGLEKKRARRKEKLYEKHCRLRNQGKVKGRRESVVLPGQGAEKMKRMGEAMTRNRGHGGERRKIVDMGIFSDEAEAGQGHILSY